MVTATVQYLLQQGHAPGQIVVLTPYLGQLWALRDAIMKLDQEARPTPLLINPKS